MSQITAQQRTQRVQELLSEINKMPPERHETRLIHLTTGPTYCDVIQMKADEVLLNHRSHRIRSQLEGDPEWEALKSDPTSEGAQRVIEYHVREARSEQEFNELKESLQKVGQVEPGVMTHDGVLVNANTRAVAMRDTDDPDKRNLRVAVLPRTIDSDEIGLLELRLQMQKELKVEYSLTNNLLFIEELSNERGMPDAAIAKEMFPEDPKKGAKEVPIRLKYLDLLRTMQRIPLEPLKLKDFDELKLQHMKDVYATHERLLEKDPMQARSYLENFLLSVLVGVVSVHQIREIDPEFVTTYLLPSLEDDEIIGQQAVQLAVSEAATTVPPKGAKYLLGGNSGVDPGAPNVVSLINAVSGRDHNIKVPGSNIVLEQKDVISVVRDAYVTGIKYKKRDERESNRLEAPLEAVKSATREVAKAIEALKLALGETDFDATHRKSLEASFKRLTRTQRSLEAALTKAGVLGS